MKEEIFIGIDIGGTKILGALVSKSGNVLLREKISVPKLAGSLKVINICSKIIQNLRKKVNQTQKLLGIGLGVPGLLDKKRETIITCPNLNIKNLKIVKIISTKFKVPVKIENDVNAGLLGEKWLGAAKNAKNVIGIFPGTGIGGGILINGELYIGSNGAAAELGHVTIEIKGRKCGCMNLGCLEAYASRSAIEKEIQKALKNGKKSCVYKLSGGNISVIKSGVLKKALLKNDKLVKSELIYAAKILAASCLSFRRIFDPELFVFGGGLIEALGDFILPIIQNDLNNDPFFAKLPKCKIAKASLGDDAVILGAVKLHLNNEINTPINKLPNLSLRKGFFKVNNESLKNDFYIKSKGKIKLLNRTKPVKSIGLKAIKKICTPKTDVLFYGYALNSKISNDAMDFLHNNSISIVEKPYSEIIPIYNSSTKRKALLVHYE